VNSTEAKQLICDILDLREELLEEAESRHKNKISRNTCKAIAIKRAAGKKYSAIPPFGWKHEKGMVVEDEQAVLYHIYYLREVEKLGATAISNQLGKEKFHTRGGKLVWQPSTVHKIIKHPLVVDKFDL